MITVNYLNVLRFSKEFLIKTVFFLVHNNIIIWTVIVGSNSWIRRETLPKSGGGNSFGPFSSCVTVSLIICITTGWIDSTSPLHLSCVGIFTFKLGGGGVSRFTRWLILFKAVEFFGSYDHVSRNLRELVKEYHVYFCKGGLNGWNWNWLCWSEIIWNFGIRSRLAQEIFELVDEMPLLLPTSDVSFWCLPFCILTVCWIWLEVLVSVVLSGIFWTRSVFIIL